MTAKAVYNNQYLGIYISKDDLDVLLSEGSMYVSLQYGSDKTHSGLIWVTLDSPAGQSIEQWTEGERAVIERVKKETGKKPDFVRIKDRGPGGHYHVSGTS